MPTPRSEGADHADDEVARLCTEVEDLVRSASVPGRNRVDRVRKDVAAALLKAESPRAAGTLSELQQEVDALTRAVDLRSDLEALESFPAVALWASLKETLAGLRGRVACDAALDNLLASRVHEFGGRLTAELEARVADRALRSAVTIARERSDWWYKLDEARVTIDQRITYALFALFEEERIAAELEQLRTVRELGQPRDLRELFRRVSAFASPYREDAIDCLRRCASDWMLDWALATPDADLVILPDGSKLPSRVEDPRTGVTFVLVPPGEFVMGAAADDEAASRGERPAHRVRLTRPFYLADAPVTVQQFRTFAGDEDAWRSAAERDGGSYALNGATGEWSRDERATWREPFPSLDVAVTEQHPVVHVDWSEANEFAERFGYRLPTEAEWEYACRAGMDAEFWWGDAATEAAGRGNFRDASARSIAPAWSVATFDDGHPVTSPVGAFPANAWGLRDMLGNVWEWVADSYQDDAYQRTGVPRDDYERVADPVVRGGLQRVVRGGAWSAKPEPCWRRSAFAPEHRSDDVGFRVARSVDASIGAETVRYGSSGSTILPISEPSRPRRPLPWGTILLVSMMLIAIVATVLVLGGVFGGGGE